ncbi:MAG: peptidoglycan-binding protein [Lachnospiraceae bacterium]
MQNKMVTMLQDEEDSGKLTLNVQSDVQLIPIENAIINISYTGDPGNPIATVRTDESGQTEDLTLPAPPLQYSQQPGEMQPYSEYNISVTADGYEPVEISGTEIFADELAIQPVKMTPKEISQGATETIVIGPHTLFGDFPPKIAEAEIKPLAETGEIVLSRVVVPEFVVVHDGPPTDSAAQNYYVRYKDYIKNVASCEIYSTWPDETIRANVLAIMSFTLNRVYTEWYRNKGYDFTITSSTAYDHKFIYGRNIFENISQIVDELFTSYISRPNVRQPILTQYCDGKRVTCPNWLSQWGSKYLGDQNYSAIEILRYYYGDNVYINNAEAISGIPASWPGYDLTIGSTGDKVSQMQEELNTIAQVYTAIPTIGVDGIYGQNTANAVRAFQKIFKLPETGVVDYPTWYKISEIFVGVTRIAELQ